MKIGIFGDIHGNLPALKAVYQTLVEKKCHKLVCTGDVVGYGPQPCECIEFLMDKKIETVCGNHDECALLGVKGVRLNSQAKFTIEWTREQLTHKHLLWLSLLKHKINISGVDFVHATHIPNNKWFYVFDKKSIEESFRYQKARVSFNGHTHVPILTAHNDGLADRIASLKNGKLCGGEKFMINVGSVGQPRDKNPQACCVTFDTKTEELEIIRVPYEIKEVTKLMEKYNFPTELITRLTKGN